MPRSLTQVNTRLFDEDIALLKELAEESGLPWQIELRMLVHRAIKEQQIQILEIEPAKPQRTRKEKKP